MNILVEWWVVLLWIIDSKNGCKIISLAVVYEPNTIFVSLVHLHSLAESSSLSWWLRDN